MQQFCKVLTSNVTVKPFLRLRLSLREKFPNTEFFLVRIFRVFGLNTEICGVNLRNESEYRKTRTRKNSLFGHFSRSVSCLDLFSWNVENWEASFKETKNSISIKLRYFHCFSHSVSYGVKFAFKTLFWIFDWRHQIGICERFTKTLSLYVITQKQKFVCHSFFDKSLKRFSVVVI